MNLPKTKQNERMECLESYGSETPDIGLAGCTIDKNIERQMFALDKRILETIRDYTLVGIATDYVPGNTMEKLQEMVKERDELDEKWLVPHYEKRRK